MNYTWKVRFIANAKHRKIQSSLNRKQIQSTCTAMSAFNKTQTKEIITKFTNT